MTATLDANGWLTRGEAGPSVVALGGGHGLSATLRALRHVTRNLTAVVTVADDGGSSGRLRQQLSCLPPGDLRMALAALCDESEWGLTWRDVMQYRFHTDGDLNDHALGNLLITGLWELLGDSVEGLDWVAKLLGAHGRVLPMASVPLEIEADLEWQGDVRTVRGQSKVAVAHGEVKDIRLNPAQPPVPHQTLAAVRDADWVVLGPGSWYTSVLPHLLVNDLAQQLLQTKARRALVVNLACQVGETENLSLAQHLGVLKTYAPDLRIDVVIADPAAVEDIDALTDAAHELGASILLRQVRTGDGKAHHDPLRLAAAFRDAFEGFLGDVEPLRGVDMS
ncbi:MAG: uridine diphosphate-N-acetylglucosamine-binding protein YvcK [Actinomycetaceae bacterium]|nr:uridine diphosphate-N-acetylglucosamine-binding protein YvcK [Actinomycetaceae bacterium]